MRVALTGASGLVGRFIDEGLRAAGHEVLRLGRQGADLSYALGASPPSLMGCDALVHAAFSHVPGRYRGGEGDDPEGFVAQNLNGTVQLFERAVADEVRVIVFLSSRAVYDGAPPGTRLTEARPLAPTSLYGQVKADAEAALAALPVASVSLRATGVYGPEKWQALIADYLAGRSIAPRAGTEVHGRDLAAAVLLALGLQGARALNVSDLLLDRHDLFAEVQRLTGVIHPLPARADAPVSEMDCTALRALGWRPGGWPLLCETLKQTLRR